MGDGDVERDFHTGKETLDQLKKQKSRNSILMEVFFIIQRGNPQGKTWQRTYSFVAGPAGEEE